MPVMPSPFFAEPACRSFNPVKSTWCSGLSLKLTHVCADSRSSREGFAAELVSFFLLCAGGLLPLFAFFFLFLNPVVFHGSRTAPVGVLLAVQAK